MRHAADPLWSGRVPAASDAHATDFPSVAPMLVSNRQMKSTGNAY